MWRLVWFLCRRCTKLWGRSFHEAYAHHVVENMVVIWQAYFELMGFIAALLGIMAGMPYERKPVFKARDREPVHPRFRFSRGGLAFHCWDCRSTSRWIASQNRSRISDQKLLHTSCCYSTFIWYCTYHRRSWKCLNCNRGEVAGYGEPTDRGGREFYRHIVCVEDYLLYCLIGIMIIFRPKAFSLVV